MKAEIDRQMSYGADLIAAIESAGGLNFSIGYRIIDADWGKDALGRGTFYLKRLYLGEISIVTTPCSSECQIVDYAEKTKANAEDAFASAAAALATLYRTLRT